MQDQATKPKRRTRVAGAPGIYRSISGAYEIAFRDSDGKLRFETLPNTAKLADAKAARAEKTVKIQRGEQVVATRRTFGTWSEEWLTLARGRERTIAGHTYALNRHLLPRFRNRKLGSITANDVAALVVAMEKDRFAAWTILSALKTFSAVMTKARRNGLIPTNPVRELERHERPSAPDPDRKLPTREQVGVLLAKADGFRPVIALLLFTGVRISEALALRWTDVDFTTNTIRVHLQLSRNRELVEPKTKASRRDIPLTPDLAKILREHKVASRYSQPSDFMFASPDGRPRDQRSVSRGIERAVKRAKLEELNLSAHAFRHWFASYLIVALKLDTVTVSKLLGHANPGITARVYAHEFDQARNQDELRSALADGLSGIAVSS